MMELITLKTNMTKNYFCVMLKDSEIPERFFRNSGPCDIMSDTLETREPPGHARGIGVNVLHKRAFTLSKEESLGLKKSEE